MLTAAGQKLARIGKEFLISLRDYQIEQRQQTTIVTIGAANIKTSGFAFGAVKLRAGEVGWVATRKFTAGAQQPLFALAAAS